MTNIKTAISIRQSLFDQADKLARQPHVSRSELFGMAVEEYIRHYQNQQLLEKLNDAYAEETELNEQTYLRQMRKQHRKILGGEW